MNAAQRTSTRIYLVLAVFFLLGGGLLVSCEELFISATATPTLSPTNPIPPLEETRPTCDLSKRLTPSATKAMVVTVQATPEPTQQTAPSNAPTSVLSAAQLTQLAEVSLNYISPDPESADQTVKEMNYAAGADASLTCGPLAIAILQDAELLSPYFDLNDFWLSSPLPGKNEPIFQEAFPENAYEWKRDETPMAEMDFIHDPLLPGDFIYTFGGNYEHMFTVTRVDEAGRAYTVQNIEQGYLNGDPEDISFIIQETMLYDPQNPGEGIIHEWADEVNWKLGLTGTEGYMRFRPLQQIAVQTQPERELAAQMDAVIEETGGKWNILIETLDGRIIYERRADEKIHPASTIKVAIAMATFDFLEQFGEGTLDQRLQRGPIYNIMPNDRSYEQLLRAMLVYSEEDSADILYENIHNSPINEYTLLESWGLATTNFEPRKTTAREMNRIYRGLYTAEFVNQEEQALILNWLAEYTANDDLRLGRMNELSASETPLLRYNKRGSLTSPQLIVADSGIVTIGDEVFLLQFYAYQDAQNSVTYEKLEQSLGDLAIIVGSWLLDQTNLNP